LLIRFFCIWIIVDLSSNKKQFICCTHNQHQYERVEQREGWWSGIFVFLQPPTIYALA
jgi:hypothetical protein